MPRFIPYDPKQIKLVAISYADQLQPGTFEFAINHLIDHKLDLSIFQARYANDDGGRPAYDPGKGDATLYPTERVLGSPRARLARTVCALLPHHITQRGNRRGQKARPASSRGNGGKITLT